MKTHELARALLSKQDMPILVQTANMDIGVAAYSFIDSIELRYAESIEQETKFTFPDDDRVTVINLEK